MPESALKTAAVAAGIAIGSSGVIILVCALFIGTLLLSLIPIYTSNDSVIGYGDVYVIPGYAVKAIYTNITGANFTGGVVINNALLSSICTAILRSKNIQDVYACVASNFAAYGPTNDTTYTGNMPVTFRRRALDDVAVYEIGDIYILFSSTCGSKRTQFIPYSTLMNGPMNACNKRRLSACTDFLNTPNNGSLGNRWYPFPPTGFSQLLYTNGTNNSFCASMAISNLYALQYNSVNNLLNLNSRYTINTTRIPRAFNGQCQLYDIWPQSTLKSFVDATTFLSTPCLNITNG